MAIDLLISSITATARKIKLGKISIVVFLTALIWVWADLAKDEPLTLSNVVLEVAKSSNPALWVNFVGPKDQSALLTSIPLKEVVLKGPASQKAKVDRLNAGGALDLNLFMVPEREGFTETAVRTLDVLDFLRRSDEIRELGLSVESCEPKTLTIRVQELVRASVPVECVGLDPSQVATLDPPAVDAYVLKEEAQVLKATVRLTPEEQIRAKNTPIEKVAYVQLAAGQPREALRKVKVTLAPAQNPLKSYQVPATVSFCFSQNMQGKYQVILENDRTELDKVMIKATEEAQLAYARTQYQLNLYIKDSDRQVTELPIHREVEFNFPEESLRKGEIEADQPKVVARFTLRPIVEASTPAGP